MPRVSARELRKNLLDFVDLGAIIMTDKHKVNRNIARDFKDHRRVDHSLYEYYRHEDEASTNTAESSFAQLKRGIYGCFHHVGKQHLQRYCDEFDFRWNYRKTSDVERTLAALKQADGVRLTYRVPVSRLRKNAQNL